MISNDDLKMMNNPDLFIKAAEQYSPLLKFMRSRFSVRSFSQQPIEKDKLKAILTAGQIAPTAVNFQPQKIFVLQSDSALSKIRHITNSTYDAPTVLLVCADTDQSWHSRFVPDYDSGESDAAIVCTHMMLEAWELGIGSVWVLLFDPERVRKAFDLSSNLRPICLLPIGYPSKDCTPYKPWHDVFKPLKETVVVL